MSDLRPQQRSDPAKGLAGAAGALLLAAILRPVTENWRRRPRDAFPLSYYPMFSAKRTATGRVTHVIGIDAQGQRQMVSHRYAGSGGLNQVRRQLHRSVRAGRAEACAKAVAERVAASSSRRLRELVEVRIVTGEYRFDDYFAGDKAPVAEKVHARHPVPRPATQPLADLHVVKA